MRDWKDIPANEYIGSDRILMAFHELQMDRICLADFLQHVRHPQHILLCDLRCTQEKGLINVKGDPMNKYEFWVYVNKFGKERLAELTTQSQ